MNRSTRRILLTSILVGVVLSIGSLAVVHWTKSIAVAAGAILGSLNLWLLVRMAIVLLAERAAGGSSRGVIVRFLVKYGILGAALAGALLGLRLDPLALAAGLANVPLAIMAQLFMPPVTEE